MAEGETGTEALAGAGLLSTLLWATTHGCGGEVRGLKSRKIGFFFLTVLEVPRPSGRYQQHWFPVLSLQVVSSPHVPLGLQVATSLPHKAFLCAYLHPNFLPRTAVNLD